MSTLVNMVEKNSRRGRLPAAERERRREAVLDAAEAVMLEVGYEQATMLAIAQRAGASKETLYSWFGNRDGLVSALIERSADQSAAAIDAALSSEQPVRETLVGFGTGLVTLLTGPTSIAMNHAAMQSQDLAARLLASGRYRVGPLVEQYFTERAADGDLQVADAADAFEVFYGLLIRDTQIRVLLGEAAPRRSAINRRAGKAVDQFLQLYGT